MKKTTTIYICDGCGKERPPPRDYDCMPYEWMTFRAHGHWKSVGGESDVPDRVSRERFACSFECVVKHLDALKAEVLELAEQRRKKHIADEALQKANIERDRKEQAFLRRLRRRLSVTPTRS